MNDTEIQTLYTTLKAYHEKYLKKYGVKLPKLKTNGKYTKGEYKLKTLEFPYPSFIKERRKGFNIDWENLKQQYDFRCATCGASEGEKHWLRKSVTVCLQKGHINPTKKIQIGNIIPQCQICNRAYKDKWIFDKTGRVIEVAQTNDGEKVIIKF